jgi:hypothetical protein
VGILWSNAKAVGERGRESNSDGDPDTGDETMIDSGVASGRIVTDRGDGPSAVFTADSDGVDVFTKCLQNAATCVYHESVSLQRFLEKHDLQLDSKTWPD